MTPVHYHISESQVVAAGFRNVLELARSQGRLPLALRAARYLWDELGYDPMNFGESRGYLFAAELFVRVGFARPLYVEYGVHERSRTVFLRRFMLVR